LKQLQSKKKVRKKKGGTNVTTKVLKVTKPTRKKIDGEEGKKEKSQKEQEPKGRATKRKRNDQEVELRRKGQKLQKKGK
jgi:hypothetical protein